MLLNALTTILFAGRTFAAALTDEALRVVATHLDPTRWTILKLPSGALVHGLVLGRRTVKKTGVLAFLALQDDNSLRVHIVPFEGEVVYIEEEEVRKSFVWSNRAGYIPRGHAFLESPVDPSFCLTCGLADDPTHAQDRLRLAIERVVEAKHVTVDFVPGTTKITGITIHPPPPADKPRLNPVPGLEALEPTVEIPPTLKPPRVLTSREIANVLKLACPPARIALTADSWNQMVGLVEEPPEPTDELRKLLR
jgi:hypothetical protein